MKRKFLAVSALTLFGLMSCGCSTGRPFWMAGKSDAAATDVATASTDAQSGSSQERSRTGSAKRSYEGPLALARLAEHGGNSVEAERLYQSIMEKSPDSATAPHRLAIMQSQKGQFEEAERYFKRALELAPDDPVLLSDAGYNCYLQDRLDEAEPLLRHALEIRPDYEAAKNNLAMVVGQRGDYRTALNLFRQTGTESEAYCNLGFVYARHGELLKAKEAYNHALTIDPQMHASAEALVQLAQFEKRAKSTLAKPSDLEVVGERRIAANRANTTTRTAAGTAVSPQTVAPSVNSVSSANRMASYMNMGQQAVFVPAKTAEYVSPEQTTAGTAPVIYPEETPTSTPQAPSIRPLPPLSQREATTPADVDETLKAVVFGFTKDGE